MDNPKLAFKLLTTNDAEEARSLASELDSLNNKRKEVVARAVVLFWDYLCMSW